MNENLHFRFFEDKLGDNNASVEFYSTTHRLDPNTIMFLNEYNTIEQSKDKVANPDKKKLNEILSFPGNENLLAGIGLQGHFSSGKLNIAYMRSSLDILGTTGLPIWLTKVDAENFEEKLKEGYLHPAVKGNIMFAGPNTNSLNDTTTLTNKSFKNTPSGDVVDKLITEWKSGAVDVKPMQKDRLICRCFMEIMMLL
ncbi:hypothetical protein FEM48_Zijuj09G0136700 [Ziziphus jujuba var. spinosa]|uniref:GH10 domain-containing protein n=1 Tax=Ziziphus jujuba var. spinosa TaxID=714518 RepID=A0A978UTB9_ZIZJJ|nr:hypothetical protein FEM48_Zijuj09G0136700 [Ziziphus jujuba var. spinosa]